MQDYMLKPPSHRLGYDRAFGDSLHGQFDIAVPSHFTGQITVTGRPASLCEADLKAEYLKAKCGPPTNLLPKRLGERIAFQENLQIIVMARTISR
jgi:hypothetical protein